MESFIQRGLRCTLAISAIALAPPGILAQAPVGGAAAKAAATASPAKYVAPRLADGHPDLSGFWSNNVATPLQRPDALAGREFLKPEEVKAVEAGTIRNDDDRVKGAPCVVYIPNSNCQASSGGPRGGPGGVGDYNAVFLEDGKKVVRTLRTSIVVEPKDGKVPALLPDVQKKVDADRAYQRAHTFDGPESLSNMDRCLTGNQAGPPMLPGAYNNTYHLVQTPAHVAIAAEMIHDVRIVPMDGRPRDNIGQWLGESRGHWEGDTLVVQTTGYNGRRNWFLTNIGKRSDARLKVTERFTRTAADTLLYQFTVDDPGMFSKPWSGEIPMVASSDPIYEYACHEGNYSMPLILSGARADERSAGSR